MPKYFFNYRCGRQVSHDDHGVEFGDVEAAYLGAFDGALDMWPELLRARVDPRACAFEVADEKGRLMFVLPFAEVLESCKREPTTLDSLASRAFVSVVEAREHARQRLTEFRNEVCVTRQVLRESYALMAAVDQLVIVRPIEPARLAAPKASPETPE